MGKSQFLSSEIMKIRFPPFINSVTGAYIIGTDACTLFFRRPDNSLANVPMVWDANIFIWTYDFAVIGYMQGEWRFRGVSTDPNALPQWKTGIYWGDYVDDIRTIRKIQTNRWRVDVALRQLIMYEDDGVTIMRTWNLFDDAGVPSGTRVFERI